MTEKILRPHEGESYGTDSAVRPSYRCLLAGASQRLSARQAKGAVMVTTTGCCAESVPEYFAKPGITEALSATHPALLVRQMANEIIRLRSHTASETKAIQEISASGNHPVSMFVGQHREWLRVFVDHTLPEDTIELRDGVTGRVMGRIVNVGR